MITFEAAGRVLVLAPHTDDAELGCGGTIARLVRTGAEVTVVAFSTCAESLPVGLPPDTLQTEMQVAARALGLTPERLRFCAFPVRRFPEHRQAILETMLGLRRTLAPSLVLLPGSSDVHQDHRTITAEGIRAFKARTVLGYELPWNQIETSTAALIGLEAQDLEAKVTAIRAYRSQAFRPYGDGAFARHLAGLRGLQAGLPQAEAFEVVRLVL